LNAELIKLDCNVAWQRKLSAGCVTSLLILVHGPWLEEISIHCHSKGSTGTRKCSDKPSNPIRYHHAPLKVCSAVWN